MKKRKENGYRIYIRTHGNTDGERETEERERERREGHGRIVTSKKLAAIVF